MEQAPLIKAYIAVGSNIEPEENIPKALEKLKRNVRVKTTSTFYRTMPIGRPEQDAFLNGIWEIETKKTAHALKFDVLRRIETEIGRMRTDDKYAARTIDLDIALYGDLVIDAPDFQIPDPDIRTRPFIAVPLLELAPALVLPDTGEQLASIAIAPEIAGLEPVDDFTASLRERIEG